MKRLIVSALVLATVLATVLGLVGTALAGEEAFLSGKDLHELCKGGDVSCTTYVMGVTSTSCARGETSRAPPT
jgi:hypothetical protein